ncbi:hypothetical protein AOQ84DRAFT_375017 [Glonium stellatum]|uniref:WSC domain-containing protein n=1 Tax=Glonium stellatum TaxID=574774 RepID=A0A8E2F4K9_9PEZI|nr:hypothetical protein AOQ84DRAFT_375017 [Glonium stellatum]
MVSTSVVSAMVAASLLSLVSGQTIPTPTYTGSLNAMTDEGCFSTGDPLEDHGSYTFQSTGNCQPICVGLGKPVMGLVNGSNCWCGDLLPPKAAQVDNSSCNTPCNGYNLADCGGNNFWSIYLTGLNHNSIANYDPSSASSAGAAKTSAPAAVVTVGGSTVVMTVPGQSGTSKPSSSPSSGPNKAGIAAGVVVGVVGLAGIIAGVMLYLRQKRRREVEEEYRRQAAVSSFVGAGKLHTSNSSMNDSRLDPEVMLRRQSDGSIADNEDYSRRILKVTNPDGH